MGKICIAECVRVSVSADILGWQNDMIEIPYLILFQRVFLRWQVQVGGLLKQIF